MTGDLEIVPDETALARRVADLFVDAAAANIADHGFFGVSLAGGSTPAAAFDLLAGGSERGKIDWKRVLFYFGDERCVPPDDPESNYRMAREHLFEPLAIAPDQVHRMRAEAPPPEAAAEYEALLRNAMGDPPVFDLIMLGMGPDGHTASLFPGTLGQIDPARLVAPIWVEKFNTHRITLTPRTINAARAIVVAAGGEAKAGALAHVLNGPREPDLYPSQILNPADGTLRWIVDRAAAKGLSG